MEDNLLNLENREYLIDFGRQPVSNRFLSGANDSAPEYSLRLDVCIETGLVCIDEPFPTSEIRPQYDWLTCFEPENHLDDLAIIIINLPGITKDSVFGSYSFKDDSTIRRIKDYGYKKSWQIDPVHDLNITNSSSSVESYQDALTENKARNIVKKNGFSDVFIIRHVLEHSYHIENFVNYIKLLITENGYIVWEIPDCERALRLGDCTTVWEEHIYYFTSFTFKNFLYKNGFSVEYYKSIKYPLENSMIAIVKKKNNHRQKLDNSLVQSEIIRAQKFAKKINNRRIDVRKELESIRKNHGNIAIYGGGHLAVAFMSLLKLYDLISYVIDDNPNKKGMYMPIGNIEIIDSSSLIGKNISVCLLAINPINHDLVINKNSDFVDCGGLFLSIFPGTNYYIESY